VIVGLLHPGEMGSAVGDVLVDAGHEVVWASDGRSAGTRGRSERFRDIGSVANVVAEAACILSICPPHAAGEVAAACRGFAGIYLDANAISPRTALEIAALQPTFVDGGIVGGPPREPGTILYLSGDHAHAIEALFAETILETRVVRDASAMKMVYAAWTKGTAAMLLAIAGTADFYGVADEWGRVADLQERLSAARMSARRKGWRWVGEMEEIADTFAAAGQPDGFHRAAAEVYRS